MSFDANDSEITFLYELQRDSETSKLASYLRRSENPAVRRRAAEILGDFDDLRRDHKQEEVVQALISAVKDDGDASVRARAIDSLYRHGQETLERLISELTGFEVRDTPDWVTARSLTDWLDADYPEFRMVAAAALGEIGGKDEVPALVEAFEDPDPRVRARAVRSAGTIGHPQCVEALKARLTDDNRIVQRAATQALGSIGTEEALEALVPVARADSESLRRIAVTELGQLNRPKAVIVLIRCVEDDSGSVQRAAVLSLVRVLSEVPEEETTAARELVADQLESADTTDAVPELIEIVREDGQIRSRRNAVWLLGRVADDAHRDDVVDCLVDTLDHPDDVTAHFAATSLVELGGEDLVRRLRIVVQNERGSPDAVERAEFALREMDATPSGELVTNSVEYTYVRDPADYTEKKRADDSGDADED